MDSSTGLKNEGAVAHLRLLTCWTLGPCRRTTCRWGGNFTGVRDKPVDLGSEELNRRVVYTPHV